MENDNDKIKKYEKLLRNSLKEIEFLRSRVSALSEPIAIIGMSCRFPGNCNTPEAFWELIANNRDAITEIPLERWNVDDYYDTNPETPGKMYVRKGGFISQKVNEFDAKLFSVSPTEAIDLDPQQRILLELAWEAFENADYDVSGLVGSKTGVFIGIATPDYANLIRDKKRYDLTKVTPYTITGSSSSSMASGRISHFFGLQGPAISLDTACSSSLVTTHLACESIRRGECEMALAGGINLNLSPTPFIGLCRMRALAPDGHCKTFDASGDGYGRSEGGGIILLKRLSAARRDGDPILAIIKGSAINEDGPSSGLTVPNGNAQELLLEEALKNAHLLAEDISYLEAHGTGTSLGDPIEMHSVARVLGKNRAKENFLFLGAVKSNIGHTESGAGVAGIIKAVLCLQHKKIPPMTIKKLNPGISLEKIPAKIPEKLIDWENSNRMRYVGVSAFGISGTNAHVILSEAPQIDVSNKTPQKTSHILALSAKTAEALNALVSQYVYYLENVKADLADISYSANTGRKHFPAPHRLAFIADSKESLREKLKNHLEGKNPIEEHFDSKLESTAHSYREGATINWRDFYGNNTYQKVRLPNYPFQRKPYWIDLDLYPFSGVLQTKEENLPLQAFSLPSSGDEHLFIFKISLQNLPEVLDVARSLHIGFSQEMLLNALTQLEPVRSYTVEDMSFLLPLLIEKDEIRLVLLSLLKEEGSYRFKFQSYQQATKKWSSHIKGRIIVRNENQRLNLIAGNFKEDQIKESPATFVTESFYKMLDARTMFLGSSVRLVERVWVEDKQLLAKFFLRPVGAPEKKYVIPLDVAVFDTCAQLFHAVLPKEASADLKMMVLKLGRLSVDFSVEFKELWCRFKMIEKDPRTKDVYVGEFSLQNERGDCIAECRDFRMKGATDAALKSLEEALSHEIIATPEDDQLRKKIVKLPDEEKKSFVSELILAELAAVLTLTKEEILPQESINNLGMDSIMGISFKNAIMRKIGADIPLEEIVLGPSPEKLVNLVLSLLSSTNKAIDQSISNNNSMTDSLWFVGERKPHAKFRLFCLPYGGGGAGIYREWQKIFSEDIDVCPIQLPGRESRIKESPYTEIYKLIEDLTEAMLPKLDLPFAIIGHSFGALLAFLVAKNLAGKYKITPTHLFVSAFTSPSIPNTRLTKFRSNPEMTSFLGSFNPNELLPEEINLIIRSNIFPESARIPKEMLPLYIKIGMSDIKVLESYRHTEGKLDCSITALYGEEDQDVPKSDMQAWQSLTTKNFQLYKVPGDHLFINEESARNQIIAIIESMLKKELKDE